MKNSLELAAALLLATLLMLASLFSGLILAAGIWRFTLALAILSSVFCIFALAAAPRHWLVLVVSSAILLANGLIAVLTLY